jgi:hypothetical protein
MNSTAVFSPDPLRIAETRQFVRGAVVLNRFIADRYVDENQEACIWIGYFTD